MKLRINTDQLQELSEEQKQKLHEWWQPEPGDSFAIFISGGWHLPKYDGPPVYHESRIKENIVGACGGYWDCECVIDDGEDPAATPDKTSLPLLSIGQMIEMLQKLNPYTDWDIKFSVADTELCDTLFCSLKAVL